MGEWLLGAVSRNAVGRLPNGVVRMQQPPAAVHPSARRAGGLEFGVAWGILSQPAQTHGRLLPRTTGELLNTLKGHTQAVNSVCVTPDGKTIVSGSGNISGDWWTQLDPDNGRLLDTVDNTVRLWRRSTGRCLPRARLLVSRFGRRQGRDARGEGVRVLVSGPGRQGSWVGAGADACLVPWGRAGLSCAEENCCARFLCVSLLLVCEDLHCRCSKGPPPLALAWGKGVNQGGTGRSSALWVKVWWSLVLPRARLC